MIFARNVATRGRTVRAFCASFALVACALASPMPAEASESEAAVQFIRDFTDEAIVKLTDDGRSSAEKVSDFRELLVRGFYLDGIGRFVLGPHWRRLDEQAQADYLQAFEDYLVATYSRRMDDYAGEQLDVLAARKRKKDYVVQSTLSGSDFENMRIDWRVRLMDGHWKIVDVAQ